MPRIFVPPKPVATPRTQRYPARMRFTIVLATLLTLTTSAIAAPKGKPSTNQDGSAPRAALLMYDKMVGPNESDKALGLYYAQNTRERALADALAKCDGAIANLRAKAAARFGADAADKLIRVLDATTTSDINAARIDVEGDTAKVTFPASSHPTTMVRVHDEWKIAVKSFFDDLPISPRLFRVGLAKVATAANAVAAKIEEGQYANFSAAEEQLKSDYQNAFRNPN
jgi:hypothetical protein